MTTTDPTPAWPAQPATLATATELADACDDDPLCMWAAQDLGAHVRAWAMDGAVVIACPDLARRDRLAVHGTPQAVAALLTRVLPHVPPGYRLVGDVACITALAEEVPGLVLSEPYGWMDTTRWPAPGEASQQARWLSARELPGVTELLKAGFPNSLAWPGLPGVRRWAGICDDAGRPIAVAADAWSAPALGFIAGVVVHPRLRGRRLAEAVCSFAMRELLGMYGRVGLMVGADNPAAVRVYERLGFTFRMIRSAGVPAVSPLRR